jgi:putative ABC transport system permease protein
VIATLRFAIRRWLRAPAVPATAVLMLTLGVAATTAISSVVESVLYRAEPWSAPDRLVIVHAVMPEQRRSPASAATWNRAPISWRSWQDLQQSPAFEGVGAWIGGQQVFGDSRSDIVSVFYASSSFLTVLGLRPALGRSFQPADDADISDVVIISHETWHQRFNARADIIGQPLSLAYMYESPIQSKRIIGVLPPNFRFQGEAPEILLPIGLMAFNGSFEENRFLRIVARLARNVSVEQAGAIAEPLVRRQESSARRTSRVVSLAYDRYGAITNSLWLLLVGAGLLLAIACSNLASMLLVDVSVRRDEFATRSALGASRRELLRQLTCEYGVLALIASAAGVLLAYWMTPVLALSAPAAIRLAAVASVSERILLGSLVAGVVTSLLFGVAPALFALPAAGMRAAATLRGHRLIVATQVALALVLVVCAILFGQTVIKLQAQPLGFNPEGLLVVRTRMLRLPPISPVQVPDAAMIPGPSTVLATRQRLNAGWMHTEELLERLASLPGVTSVAGASGAPFLGTARVATVREATAQKSEEHFVEWRTVTENYFSTMEIPIIRGRSLAAVDRALGEPYWVVVSDGEERKLTGGHALGKQLAWGVSSRVEVIGVAGSVQHRKSEHADTFPVMYLINFRVEATPTFLIRTSADPRDLLVVVRQTIEEHDQTVKVISTDMMSDLVAESRADERFRAALATLFGCVALAIAAVGLFGLTSYLLSTRRQELAIRLALGSRRSGVQRLLLRDAAVVVLGGMALGIPAAIAVYLSLRSLFFGLPAIPLNALLLGAMALSVAAVAAVATPVIRAGRLDPGRLLRN